MYKIKLPGATVWSSEPREFWTWKAANGIPVVTVLTNDPVDGVDIANADTMRRELMAAAARSKVVIVDMSLEPFCDSQGMNVLDDVADMLAEQGGELRAVISRRITLRCLLEIPQRTSQVRVFPTLQGAVYAAPRSQDFQFQAA